MGAAVLLVAIAFVVVAHTRGSVATVDGYELSAKFPSVNGQLAGSEVRIGGVNLHTQSSLNLEQLLGKFAFGTE